jgi:hypothetical protein
MAFVVGKKCFQLEKKMERPAPIVASTQELFPGSNGILT